MESWPGVCMIRVDGALLMEVRHELNKSLNVCRLPFIVENFDVLYQPLIHYSSQYADVIKQSFTQNIAQLLTYFIRQDICS